MTTFTMNDLDQQTQDYLSDLDATLRGEKPAVIIERRKSVLAYATAANKASLSHASAANPASMATGLRWLFTLLADSDGKNHPAIIAGRPETVENIDRLLATRSTMDRKTFQIAMGVQLGYDFDDCVAYSESLLGQTCGCQCCGGPTTSSKLDDERRRERLSDLYR